MRMRARVSRLIVVQAHVVRLRPLHDRRASDQDCLSSAALGHALLRSDLPDGLAELRGVDPPLALLHHLGKYQVDVGAPELFVHQAAVLAQLEEAPPVHVLVPLAAEAEERAQDSWVGARVGARLQELAGLGLLAAAAAALDPLRELLVRDLPVVVPVHVLEYGRDVGIAESAERLQNTAQLLAAQGARLARVPLEDLPDRRGVPHAGFPGVDGPC
mmetsp:Transcript_11546/g.30499  ORF Transcript_11546/g.30499 Transcript_11546/m.30499 type:complete len:216 (+) Transcript_11546:795-1442(+)